MSATVTCLDHLTPIVYGELRRLAGSYLRRERDGHTFQPTELVNEAYIRLMRQDCQKFANRAHFTAIAAQHMRQVLIDYARRRSSQKRGGGAQLVAVEADSLPAHQQPADLIALDQALTALARFDARKSRILEMHLFGGMTLDEIADALGVHVNTAARDFRLARAWLQTQLGS